MPWKLISQQPEAIDADLLIDYISPNPLVVLWMSIKSRHVPVLAAVLGSFTLIFVTVASTGLFVLRQELIEKSIIVSVQSSFKEADLNETTVDSISILLASSILSGNPSLAYPLGTNEDYATGSFVIEQTPILSKTGTVDAFSADMVCNLGSTTNSTVEVYVERTRNAIDNSLSAYWSATIEPTDGICATGPIRFPAFSQNLSASATLTSPPIPFGTVIVHQCPPLNQSTLFIVFAQIIGSAEHSGNETDPGLRVAHSVINSTVLACLPTYSVKRALVTTDISGGLRTVETESESMNFTVSDEELWQAFNISIKKARSTLVNPRFDTIYSTYDDFFVAMDSTWARTPAEYLAPDILVQDLRRLFKTGANQLANRLLRYQHSGTTTGSYKAPHLRVILQKTTLRLLEAGLVTIMVLSCLMTIVSLYSPMINLGSGVIHVAVLLSRHKQLELRLKSSGVKALEQIERELLQSEKAGRPRSLLLKSGMQWWKPLALSKSVAVVVLVIPLAIVVALEVTYRTSINRPGLGDVYINSSSHYLWTLLPALLMTGVKLLHQSVASSITLLDPFSKLRRGCFPATRSLARGNLSKTSLQLCYEGCKGKRWALFGSALSTLFGPFLTIVVSGLFLVQPIRKTETLEMQLSDEISSPTSKNCSRSDWAQASVWAANLLILGYGDYPRGTYENHVYSLPALSSDDSKLPTDAHFTNASTLLMDTPTIFSNVTCRAMDDTGFRYKYDGNNAWLNYTHPDLWNYGYGFGSHHLRCEAGIPSLGWNMRASPTRLSHVVYASEFDAKYCADPSVWPDSQVLKDGITARSGSNLVDPDLFIIYGPLDLMTHTADIRGIACYYDIRQGQANVTYDLRADKVISLERSTESFAVLTNISECVPWIGSDVEGLESLLPSKASYALATSFYTNINTFFNIALNGSNETAFDAQENVTLFAGQVSRIYNHMFTQFYNNALRGANIGNKTVPGILIDDNWQRLTQNNVSTRILQALLLTMWLCTSLALYLFDIEKLLPKNPCSIAAQASLLADSEFLSLIPPEAEHATTEQLMQMTPFRDHLFSMGWWTNANGARRFGIDIGKADFDEGENDDTEAVVEEGEIVEAGEGHDEETGKAAPRLSVDVVDSWNEIRSDR
ncbi:hypothetical protein D6C77_03631 [Aureobasidium pullulans]|nr:hypothetical protein D6C77_03631 [Aureobasidium pullulans]